MFSLKTERLKLRLACLEDAPWLLRLLNQEDFLHFIGDRGVRTLAQAERYIQERFLDSYSRYGFGLYPIERLSDRACLGLCGLVQREFLDAPDLGFALFPEFYGQGYATEASWEVLRQAAEDLRLTRLLAITIPENQSSITLLERLGFQLERELESPESVTLLQYLRWLTL